MGGAPKVNTVIKSPVQFISYGDFLFIHTSSIPVGLISFFCDTSPNILVACKGVYPMS